MSRSVNPFDPFGFFSAGPMNLLQVGLEMMQAWQRAVMPMLTLPVRLMPDAGFAKSWQFAGFMPQVDARVTPIRANRDGAAQLKLAPLASTSERLSLEAMVAQRQGRANPWLGCLQGAQIVYPETAVVDDKPAVEGQVLDAMVKKARVAKTKTPPVATSAPVKKTRAATAVGKKPTTAKAPASETKAAVARKAPARK